MAFGLENNRSSPFGNPSNASLMGSSNIGPDLEEIQTEALGFQSVAGDSKIRLVPSWPANALPSATASLLSIASRKGLLAAAGPESVIVASTESVCQAFSAPGSADGQIKSYSPQLTLGLGTRVSQVAFSADERYLVISAEHGGGLAIYSVETLMAGSTRVEFELSTNGISLRALVPNPTPEKAELFALVTTDGKLLVANLQTHQFVNSKQGQGQILRDGVSCVSWSTRGKQLVAGFGSGSCLQMTPEGEAKAEIPRPSTLMGDQHVTSISWLENNLFLTAHTSSLADPTAPVSINFHLVTRNPQSSNSFGFQKLPEVCRSFGSNRLPPCCSMQRLKDFPPSIQDLILVVSTASTDVGLFTRATVPLTNATDTQKITNTFTATVIADDARCASLPIQTAGEGADTSCIGVALDLSSNEKVKRPMPQQEEIEETSGPLPGLMVLNEEGILTSWWVVYADSVRQNTTYPGLVHGASQQPQPQAPQQDQSFARSDFKPASSFSQPSFGGNAFSKPPAPGFGTPSMPASSFVSPFGTSSGLGKPQSPWGSALQNTSTTFGQPAFGSSSAAGMTSQGAAFGAAGGNRVSPWGTQPVGSASASGSIFGQTGGLGSGAGTAGAASAFGIPAASTGGFASFANAPGFAATAAQGGGGGSVLGKAKTDESLGSGMETDKVLGESPRKPEASLGLFNGEGFKLGSIFKGDGTAANDLPKPPVDTSASLFGGNFVQSLGEAEKDIPTATGQEAQMNDNMSDYGSKDVSPIEREATSLFSQPTVPESQFPSLAQPTNGGLFGTQAQTKNPPAVVESAAPSISSPEKPAATSTTPQDTPRKTGESAPLQIIKSESEDDNKSLDQIFKSPTKDPLPPEATSKVSYAAGDTSNSSKTSAEDAPLPPDFLPPKKGSKDPRASPLEQPLVPLEDKQDDRSDDNEEDEDRSDDEERLDDEGEGRIDEDEEGRLDDDEGSGVDVAQELSPLTDPTQSPKISPESSFGVLAEKSPLNERFGKVQQDQPRQGKKTLFGEVGSTSPAFSLLPPVPKEQGSPRSPSPIRPLLTADTLRPDHTRSFSAPGRPATAIAARRKALSKMTNEGVSQRSQDEKRNQERDLRVSRQAQKAAEEEQSLSDREDEKVREELATEVEPTRDLETFLAHQDYVGAIKKAGIPGQIEALYRDINSMIDTLGLNARSLKAFVMGHTEFYKEGDRSLEDLETTDWSISEVQDLRVLEGQLFEKLEDGRIADVPATLSACREMRKELHTMRCKRQEITKAIGAAAKSEQSEAEAIQSPPLDLSQTTTQHELRRDFSRVQKQLAEAEEAISMLRVRLASQDKKSNGKTRAAKKPTVEAVTNTIKKMTSMVEKKNLDIDVLEVHMRRLGFAPALHETSTPEKKSPARRSLGNSFSSRSFTPKSSSNGVSPYANGLPGSSLRKSITMNNIPSEAVEKYKTKLQHRKAINAIIQKTYMESGPRVRGFE